MSKEEREEVKLANKIRVFEDMILRSKNLYEIETIRNDENESKITKYAVSKIEQGLVALFFFNT